MVRYRGEAKDLESSSELRSAQTKKNTFWRFYKNELVCGKT